MVRSTGPCLVGFLDFLRLRGPAYFGMELHPREDRQRVQDQASIECGPLLDDPREDFLCERKVSVEHGLGLAVRQPPMIPEPLRRHGIGELHNRKHDPARYL